MIAVLQDNVPNAEWVSLQSFLQRGPEAYAGSGFRCKISSLHLADVIPQSGSIVRELRGPNTRWAQRCFSCIPAHLPWFSLQPPEVRFLVHRGEYSSFPCPNK